MRKPVSELGTVPDLGVEVGVFRHTAPGQGKLLDRFGQVNHVDVTPADATIDELQHLPVLRIRDVYPGS
jgi:hypothetical protein